MGNFAHIRQKVKVTNGQFCPYPAEGQGYKWAILPISGIRSRLQMGNFAHIQHKVKVTNGQFCPYPARRLG